MHIDSQISFFSTLDLDRTSDFYVNLLGLSLVLDQGSCRIYSTAGNAYLGFCLKDRMPATEGVIITLVMDDVDAYCEKLRGLGVVFEKEPAFNPRYNIYHCFLRDPNGYSVEIQRFEDPDWNRPRFA